MKVPLTLSNFAKLNQVPELTLESHEKHSELHPNRLTVHCIIQSEHFDYPKDPKNPQQTTSPELMS